MRDARPRSWRDLGSPPVVLLAVASFVWVASALVELNERTLRLEVECNGPECTARVGEAELSFPVGPYGTKHQRLGLYAYHSYEFDRPQYFRGLRVEAAGSGDSVLELELTDVESAAGWEVDSGWHVRPGRGITHRGPPGSRSFAMLNRFASRDFRLSVEIEQNVDSGVMLRAHDRSNGTVVVVRSRQNDLFFFELHDGEPGPIEELTELRPLSTARESLRLAGLVAEIVSLAGLAFFLFRWLATAVGTPLGADSLPAALEADAPPAWLLPALALATFLAMAAIAWFGLEAIPHLADETAYLFQAKVFAGGALWAPAPEPLDFFRHEHIVLAADRWFGKYPPLFPMFLAIGVWLHAPWLVNPFLGAATLVGIFCLAREFTDWRWATVAALLAMSSPFFLLMGGTMMSHISSALFVTWFLFFLVRALERSDPRWGIAAGASLGLVIWTRPYTALLVAISGGLYGLAALARSADRRSLLLCAGAIGLALVPLTVGYLAWNGLHSDEATFAVGLHGTYDRTDALGFGAEKGHGWLKTWGSWGHTPAKALRSASTYLDYTSVHLLGWPFRLSLSLAVASLLFGRKKPAEWLLWLVPLGLVAGHTLYWATQHLGYGARYWFSALPALIVLTTLGLRRAITRPSGSPAVSWGVAVALVLLVGWNLTSYLPPRLSELRQYGGVSAALKHEVDRRQLDRALILVSTEGLLYNDGFFMNDPFLRNGAVFVRDLGHRNREILERYPDRPVYRWSDGELELVRSSVRRLTVAR